MQKALIIGITGGIGSGKSTLSNKLRAEGFFVYDSDVEARRLQNENPIIRKQLVKLFGDEIFTPQGLNRSALAKIVFGKHELLAQLNAIVHPVVREDLIKWIKSHNNEKLLFVESAILFESGFNVIVDKVILMTASEAVRLARVVKRDIISPEQVHARMAHQLPDESKISRVDFVIHSDDNQPLDPKMKNVIFELLKSLEA
ncbi:MAG TPA: dephospho-CoA kinase [Paludibacter sp.]